MKRTHHTFRILGPLAALGALALSPTLAAAETGDEATSYGFFRTVEGVVRLTTYESEEPIEVEPNYPVLVGDRIWVTHGARLEAVLPDRTIVRADGATDLFFDELAQSVDAEPGSSTVLGLLAGELLIEVPEFSSDLEPVRIDTTNTTVFLQSAGIYRLFVQEGSSTQLVVRDGFAEILGERGSVVVRSGEEAWAEGGSGDPRLSVRAADTRFDALESWSAELAGVAVAGESSRRVDRSLAYAAAPLDSYGSWVQMSGSWAWQPSVVGDWRPYTVGWWMYTPAGLTWVSSEPWGWVTSHYGSWSYSPGYGWLWYPGSIYSPAWVVWYWGPTHVGWVPLGYYSHFYYPPGWPGYQGSFFRYGVYGWAGGSWDYFAYWTFCPTRYFGRRYHTAYWHSGVDYARHGRQHAVPRGIVTVDSRPLTPSQWGKPSEGMSSLEAELRRRDRNARIDRLGDVTDFVARRRELPAETRRLVFRDPDAADARGDRERGPTLRRGLDASSPWTVAEPLPADVLRDARASTRLSDAAVMRGGRLDAYRAPYRSGIAPDARADSRGSVLGRDLSARFGTDRSPLRDTAAAPSLRERAPLGTRELPPAGRVLGSRFWERDGSAAAPDPRSGQVPLVRRLLDGIRSRTPGDTGGSSAAPRSAPEASQGTRQAPPPPPERASPPPPSSSRGSAVRDRSSSSSGASRRPPAARSSGSSGSRGSSSSRTSRTPRRPPS